MADQIPRLEDTPKEALASFIGELDTRYYDWYDTETDLAYYLWRGAQWVAWLSGIAAAFIAALLRDQQFIDWGFGRIALIALPLIGSLASTFIVQSRIADLESLRETGREAVQRLANQARVEYAAATSPEQYTEIHRELVAEVSALEKEQNRVFHRLAPTAPAAPKLKP